MEKEGGLLSDETRGLGECRRKRVYRVEKERGLFCGNGETLDVKPIG